MKTLHALMALLTTLIVSSATAHNTSSPLETIRSHTSNLTQESALMPIILHRFAEDEASPDEASPEKAIQNNLRMIASASMQYILDTGESSVTYKQLEGDYFAKIEPVNGEDYTSIVVYDTSSSISVIDQDGVVHTYEF